MKYNKALDYTVLAMQEMVNGKPVLAARLFAKATEQPDLQDAMRILEASNAQAFKKLQAAKVEAKVEAPKARLKADAEEVEDAPAPEPEVSEDDMEGDPLEQVADVVEDEEAVEEPAEEDPVAEEPVEESPALAVAKVLASMQRKAK